MAKMSKRVQAFAEKVDREKMYPLLDAFQLVKETASAKFDESVEVAINLGVNTRKSDQNVRGATVMPKGTGKTVRVAVFADGELADQAREWRLDLRSCQISAGLIEGSAGVLQGRFRYAISTELVLDLRLAGELPLFQALQALILEAGVLELRFGAGERRAGPRQSGAVVVVFQSQQRLAGFEEAAVHQCGRFPDDPTGNLRYQLALGVRDHGAL